ncbi:MAG: AsmA family protein [Burkholderiaceae bacterium]
MNPPSPSPRRLRPRSLAGRIALGGLIALVAFAWAFDWNWCRPLIRHYVMSHSGRSFEFDDLQVHWRHGLDPTIEFRGLTIQNAPWAASKAPFIRAGRIAATLSWRSLGSDMVIVDLIELEDAQLDMERQADGIRNWRITHPDDRGPQHVRVLALRAQRSQLHTIHRGIGLELDASTTSLAAPEPFDGHPDLPLTTLLAFKGTIRDDMFDGQFHVSDVLTFGGTEPSFSLRGQAHSGALTLEASGLSNDVHALGDLDCDIRLSALASGPAKPLPEALARLRPLFAQGHVTKSGETWRGTDVRLRAGRRTSLVADVAFSGNAKTDTPRRMLNATLRDAVIDVDDLSLLRGKTPPGEKTLPAMRPDADHALSTHPLPFDRLREFDAEIDLGQARFTGSERGLAQTLRGHATLAGGVLRLSSLDIGVAGGHVAGTLEIDAAQPPAKLSLELDAHGLRVEQLSATLAANAALTGAIDAHASVKTRGESSRALVESASGSVKLSLAEGASVSKRLDAKLGLNGGEWLRTLLDKSARVPVQCASVTLALERGVATPRHFVFETADTAIAGQGSLNLVDESVDATLTPVHKKLALLSLDKSIHAEGSWHAVKIALTAPAAVEPARCSR